MAADPAMHDEERDPASADRFLDFARRLIAVPKHEIDRLRREQHDKPSPKPS